MPRLAYGGGTAGFFVGHRGHQYASTALMERMLRPGTLRVRALSGSGA